MHEDWEDAENSFTPETQTLLDAIISDEGYAAHDYTTRFDSEDCYQLDLEAEDARWEPY